MQDTPARSKPDKSPASGFSLDRLVPPQLLVNNDSRVRSRVLIGASLSVGLLGTAVNVLKAMSFPWGIGLTIGFTISTILVLLPWVQWVTRSTRIAGGTFSALLLLVFPTLHLIVGVRPAPVLFFFGLAPLLCTFFVGVRFGAAATIFTCLEVLMLARIVPAPSDPTLGPLMPEFMAAAFAAPLLIFGLAFLYERKRAQNELRLAEINTEMRIAHEHARIANSRKTVFLRQMSHELRTPLNAILGYSALLLDEATDRDDERQSTDLRRVHSASEHLLCVINDLLDISRIEADALGLVPEDIDLQILLQEVEDLLAPLLHASGNALTIDADPGATILGDRQRLKQILQNLIGNACKFTQDGAITVTASTEGDRGIRIAIRDTGIGMSPEDLVIIFEPFAQLSKQAELRQQGTGLGLAISQKLVELFGGTLVAESRLGIGTTFVLSLPHGQTPNSA